jgi:hypothetical protein
MILTKGVDVNKPKIKETQGKWRPYYVLPSLLEEVAKVRNFGIEKYGNPDGWKITGDLEYLEAAIRHCNEALKAYQNKEHSLFYDKESGLSHFAHAACDLMFCIDKLKQGDIK